MILLRLFLLITVLVGLTTEAHALKVHSTNTRYLATEAGQAISLSCITSRYDVSWKILHDFNNSATPYSFNMANALAELPPNTFNCIRMWTAETYYWGETAEFAANTYHRFPHNQGIYLQVSSRVDTSTGVNITVPIVDLNQFNQAYFDRRRTNALTLLNNSPKIYPSVMMFGGGHNEYTQHTGFGHPYFGGNNVNGVSADANANGKVEETHTLSNATVTAYQNAYVCKLVDTFKDQPDVIFEISNEDQNNSAVWHAHIIARIRTCEQSLGSVRHIIWATPFYFGAGQFTDNSAFFALNADMISPACLGGDNYQDNPPASTGVKVIAYDTDHQTATCNGSVTSEWVFKQTTRGINPFSILIRETDTVVREIEQRHRQWLAYSTRIDLAGMVPDVAASQAYPSTAILDTFDRANEGPPPSASWVNSYGSGLKVVSNELQPNAYSEQHASSFNTSRNADQEVWARIGSTSAIPSGDVPGMCLYFRLVTANDSMSNHYELCATPISGNDVFRVWKVVGGVYTKLGSDISVGKNFSASDTYGAAMRGSVMTLWFNGVALATREDSAIAGAGYQGVWFEAIPGGSIDYFGGGNLSAVGSTVCSTGYCLKKPGVEYLLYRPSGGTNPTIDLTDYPSTTFSVELLNTATNVFSTHANLAGGGVRTITVGWSGEVVAYITATTGQLAVVQSVSCTSVGIDYYAECTLPTPPRAGNKLVLLVSMQQRPFVSSCSNSNQFIDPDNPIQRQTSHYDLGVEGPVQGNSQSSIWTREVTTTGSGTWRIQAQCYPWVNTDPADTLIALTVLEVANAVPSYAAFESPGWAGGRNLSTLTVSSAALPTQANGLAVAVLSMNVPQATFTTQSGWTQLRNNGNSASSTQAVGAAALQLRSALALPSHTWGIGYVTPSGADDAQAVIGFFRSVQSGGGGGGGQPTTINRTLRWTDNATNETSYRIEKRTDQSFPNWVSVTQISANSVTYTATIQSTETGDCWRVFAVNAYGELTSNIACGPAPNVPPTPPPPPPPPVIQIGGLQTLMDDELL